MAEKILITATATGTQTYTTLGTGVATALAIQANTAGGFPTASNATSSGAVLVGAGGSGTAAAWTLTTGTGTPVFNNTPTLITPVLGVATGTSLALTEAVGATALTITGATQTASFPCVSASQTWNNAGVSFIGQNFDVTNTASTAASSYLVRMRVGGNLRFGIAAAHFANSGALRLNEGGGNPELITDVSTAGFRICRQDGTGSLLDMTCRSYITGGDATTNAPTSAKRITKKITGIADNTATDVLTVTVPNAAHAAAIKIRFLSSNGSTDAFESSRCAEGMVVVARTTGNVATVAAVAALEMAQIATVAAGATHTLAYGVSGMTGLASAQQTFTVQVTIDDSGGTGSNQCVILAEILNAETSGISIA